MEKSESSSRGKVLLATVKGDVHDIGKNLVEIILANNGFNVVNLGIKIPPEQLITAVRAENPDIVGLSGLLVKSAQQMVVTADDLAKAGVQVPILVGGAALSENFVDRQIAPAYQGTVAYASDAMSGLELAKKIVDPEQFQELKAKLAENRAKKAAAAKGAALALPVRPESDRRSTEVSVLTELPSAPDFARHIIKNTPIETIRKYINPLMLFGRHLGIKGGTVRKLEKAQKDPALLRELEHEEPRSLEVWRAVDSFFDEYKHTPILEPSAVYQFFKTSSNGNELRFFDGKSAEFVGKLSLPRQRREQGLCLADYVRPHRDDEGPTDTAALFLVSVGKGVRELAESLKNRGDYLRSHIAQALALECAEAYAELLHSQLRKMWGFPDSPEMTMMERFQAKYRGKRYSFGYPACPRLDDQALLFSLLKPEEMGVALTEGFMMDPEASVSAVVFHHPEASYFSVGTRDSGGPDENRS